MADGGNEAKLLQFQGQLRDVDKLIALDPDNQQYLSLKKELVDVIELTKNLVRVQKQASSVAAAAAGGGGGGGGAASSAGATADDAAPAVVPAALAVGATAEAQFNKSQVWYPVRLLESFGDGTSFRVQFLTFQEEDTQSALQLRPLQGVLRGHVGPDEVPVGATVAARYSVDRGMYKALVEGVTERGYVVLYTDYGNREEVPAEWVTMDLSVVGTSGVSADGGGGAADAAGTGADDGVAPPLVKNVAGAGSSKKRKKEAEAARRAEMEARIKVIPESLKIKEDDSDAQKKKKKRITKKLKRSNKAVQMEIAQNDRASSWQKFAQKTKKKGAKGSLMKLRKQSIFASPATIDGKVGVTGSGAGMTGFEDRKKYKLR